MFTRLAGHDGQVSGTLATFGRALGTRVPSRIARLAKPSYICGPRPTGNPPRLGGGVWSHRTCGSVGDHLSREVRSEAIGNVAASKSTLAMR
jgi:hypothetical protein